MAKPRAKREIELLAPAKDAATAIDAINYGADAVYMGARKFGARALAGNEVDDLARVADYAHKFNAKLYATVNTIVYDHELRDVERLITDLYNAGTDALIVQDMSILRLDIPPIALHSSTQCDLRTPEKARFLSSLGFSQLVMARELTLDEINAIHAATDAKLEAFIYGALCVSYSGRCQLSYATKGRSANRGECSQLCRMPYDLVDQYGNELVKNRHLLSLRDLNQSGLLTDLMAVGVSSFKIEGRLKDSNYVRNAVAYFRKEIDSIIAANSDKYVRSSFGTSVCDFVPALEKSFNRSYTHYFLTERNHPNGFKMASLITPKSLGEPIGSVMQCRGNRLTIDTAQSLSNGDGLSYFNGAEFSGFRVNKVENGVVYANASLKLSPGTMIYRTYDKAHDDNVSKSKTERKIQLSAVLRVADNRLILDFSDERGNYISKAIEAETLEPAKSDQRARQRDTLAKLGNTIYTLAECDICTNAFVPASLLTQLRRDAVELLDKTQNISYRREMRKAEDKTSLCFTQALVSADNVANHVAEQLYADHGAKVKEYAIEVEKGKLKSAQPLMQTRYCIRRELGACKKSSNAKSLPDKIFLRTGKTLLAVNCDCSKCEMTITLVK